MITRNSLNGAFPIKRLGEIVEFLDSQRRPVTESDRRAGPYPYYGANGQQGTIDDFLFDEPLVLLAEDGGHFGEPDRGIAYRIFGKTWVNNHAHVLRPKPGVDLAYLCRVLENYDVTPFVTGTTRGKLTKAGAAQIAVPMPSVVEQRRIAEVLDRAEALRSIRRAASAQLDTLTQSIFLDLFGDPLSNPKGWTIHQLQEVVKEGTIVTYGIVQAGEEFPGGVPYIRTGDIVNGEIVTSGLRHTDPAIASKFSRSRVEAGDIVMSIRATVGTTALVPPELNGANLTQGTGRISPGKGTERLYLLNYLRASGTQHWIRLQIKGATFREITLSRLRELPVAIPPLPLQREFARRITAVEKLKAAHRASLTELDALFAALQHRAFRGEL